MIANVLAAFRSRFASSVSLRFVTLCTGFAMLDNGCGCFSFGVGVSWPEDVAAKGVAVGARGCRCSSPPLLVVMAVVGVCGDNADMEVIVVALEAHAAGGAVLLPTDGVAVSACCCTCCNCCWS